MLFLDCKRSTGHGFMGGDEGGRQQVVFLSCNDARNRLGAADDERGRFGASGASKAHRAVAQRGAIEAAANPTTTTSSTATTTTTAASTSSAATRVECVAAADARRRLAAATNADARLATTTTTTIDANDRIRRLSSCSRRRKRRRNGKRRRGAAKAGEKPADLKRRGSWHALVRRVDGRPSRLLLQSLNKNVRLGAAAGALQSRRCRSDGRKAAGECDKRRGGGHGGGK